MTDKFLFVFAAGTLFTFLLMTLPAAKEMKVPFFKDLFHCNLCLGTWVFFTISCFTRTTIGPYFPLISEAFTAGVLSLTSHLILLGAKTKWGYFE